MKNLKIVLLSLLVFLASGYMLNFMPVLKSNTCGCNNFKTHYVSLNYMFSCFCSATNGDDFPGFLRHPIVNLFLVILPFIFLILGFKFFKKIIK